MCPPSTDTYVPAPCLLPAVEGGIFATRTGVGSGGATESSIAWQNFSALPAGLEARLHVSQDG